MNITDFTNPQWEDRRLKEFLFHSLKDYAAPCLNHLLTKFYIIELHVENKLREMFEKRDEEGSDFNDIFTSTLLSEFHPKCHISDLTDYLDEQLSGKRKQNQSLIPESPALLYLRELSKSLSCTKFHNKLYAILIYKGKYKKNYCEAVCSLAQCLLNYDMKQYHESFSGNYTIDNAVKYWDSDNRDLEIAVLSDGNFNSELMLNEGQGACGTFEELINLKYIRKNEDAPVFIVNSAILAHKLQETQLRSFRVQRIDNIINFLEEQSEYLERAQEDGAPFRERLITIVNKIKGFTYLLTVGPEHKEKRCKVSELIPTNPDMRNLLQEDGLPKNDYKLHNHEIVQYTPADLSPVTGKYDNECDIVWSSVFGGITSYDDEEISKLLFPLKDRVVYWVLYKDSDETDILKEFIDAYQHLHYAGLKKIKFIHVLNGDKLNMENSQFNIFNPDDLLLKVHDTIHGIIPECLLEKLSELLVKHRGSKSTKDFIVFPAIRKEAIVLLTAKTGHGKSYFSMFLSYAIARNAGLFSNWKVESPCKILYIMDNEVDAAEKDKREKVLNKMIRPRSNEKSVYIKNVGEEELLDNEDGRKFIERELMVNQQNQIPQGEMPQLLILDCLTKLSRNGTSKQGWESISKWLKSLVERFKLTVLIVHHLNDRGAPYGTSFIENIANSHIYIENKSDNFLDLDILLPKNRHGRTIKSREKAIQLELHVDEHEKPYYFCPADSDYGGGSWRKLKDEVKIKLFVDYFTEDENMSNRKKTRRGFAKSVNMSLPTIEKLAGDFGLTRERWTRFKGKDTEEIKLMIEQENNADIVGANCKALEASDHQS